MESKSNKTTANRIAKILQTEYNNGKGVDIKSTRATIEVETPETVVDAPSHLKRPPRASIHCRNQ